MKEGQHSNITGNLQIKNGKYYDLRIRDICGIIFLKNFFGMTVTFMMRISSVRVKGQKGDNQLWKIFRS